MPDMPIGEQNNLIESQKPLVGESLHPESDPHNLPMDIAAESGAINPPTTVEDMVNTDLRYIERSLPTTETPKPPRSRRAIAGLALVGTLAAGAVGFGISKATGGGHENTDSQTTNSQTEAPKPPKVLDQAEDGMLWSDVRANLVPEYSMVNNLVNPEYFKQPNQSIDANVDKQAVHDTLDKLLQGRSAAIVSGNSEDIKSIYGRSSFIDSSNTNEFGVVQGQVQIVEAMHTEDAQLVAKNPNQPVPHENLVDILGVQPVTPNAVTVTAVITDVNYGKYTPGELTRPQMMTNVWAYDLEYKTITAPGGLERTIWVITGQSLVKGNVDPTDITK